METYRTGNTYKGNLSTKLYIYIITIYIYMYSYIYICYMLDKRQKYVKRQPFHIFPTSLQVYSGLEMSGDAKTDSKLLKTFRHCVSQICPDIIFEIDRSMSAARNPISTRFTTKFTSIKVWTGDPDTTSKVNFLHNSKY